MEKTYFAFLDFLKLLPHPIVKMSQNSRELLLILSQEPLFQSVLEKLVFMSCDSGSGNSGKSSRLIKVFQTDDYWVSFSVYFSCQHF